MTRNASSVITRRRIIVVVCVVAIEPAPTEGPERGAQNHHADEHGGYLAGRFDALDAEDERPRRGEGEHEEHRLDVGHRAEQDDVHVHAEQQRVPQSTTRAKGLTMRPSAKHVSNGPRHRRAAALCEGWLRTTETSDTRCADSERPARQRAAGDAFT